MSFASIADGAVAVVGLGQQMVAPVDAKIELAATERRPGPVLGPNFERPANSGILSVAKSPPW
jgi:hypothetical protein